MANNNSWSISTYILIVLTLIIGAVTAYIFFFGIPPELKKRLQDEAFEQLGENAASNMMKQALDKVPEGDQKELKQARDKLLGGKNNPLGKFANNAGDDATKDLREGLNSFK
ncbi:hypothetical protein LTR37_011011 [Vermiconidia calcicola]|uniref:Uncharacterized protein n=1 Tax=Vermiconidia calcicola TaxID=1690605 RepID=A0ACC3N3H6_9PEZI|nr:hypothetical protein LTR37_011011 [Vermiconidia calcicola]